MSSHSRPCRKCFLNCMTFPLFVISATYLWTNKSYISWIYFTYTVHTLATKPVQKNISTPPENAGCLAVSDFNTYDGTALEKACTWTSQTEARTFTICLHGSGLCRKVQNPSDQHNSQATRIFREVVTFIFFQYRFSFKAELLSASQVAPPLGHHHYGRCACGLCPVFRSWQRQLAHMGMFRFFFVYVQRPGRFRLLW